MTSRGQMQTSSSKTRSKSKTIRPSTSKIGRPSVQGHVYEYKGINDNNKYLNRVNNYYEVVIKLMDWTAGKAIERIGTAKYMTGVIWINNLEGNKNVYLELDKIGELGKIKKLRNGEFALSPYLGENAR